MSRPLRTAIVGCGSIAPTHARALQALPEADLVACADAVPERSARFAAEFGLQARSWDQLLEDTQIEALSICVPSGLHGKLGAQALRAGKHVVVEKPMDISLAACDQLLAAQEASGCTLSVISQHRFDPATQIVRKALVQGLLGEVFLVDARIPWYRTQEYYDSGDWRGTWAMDGGGCLMNQGVHTIDLMRWLAGPVDKVYAQSRTAAHHGIEVEDALSATLTFANGAIGTVMASTAAYPGFPARLALHGTRGSAALEADALQVLAIQGQDPVYGDGALAHAVAVATGGTRAATAGAAQAASDPGAVWGEAHQAQLRDFIHCCRTGDQPSVDGREGRKAVEVVLACYDSARSGQEVTLQETLS